MTHEVIQFLQFVGVGLALLLPMANPLTSMSLLISLGGELPREEQERQIKQSTIYVVLIMLVTYYGGIGIMNALDISVEGMRIAGGMVVAFIGFNMLFPSSSVGDMSEADKARSTMEHHPAPNIAFVPLALPGTAGPGTIAMIISASSKVAIVHDQYPLWIIWGAPVVIAVLLGALFFFGLRSAGRLVRMIGHEGVDAISRIMGFLLVCMGVQLVIDGVLALIAAQH